MADIEFITDVLKITVIPIVGSFAVGFALALIIEKIKAKRTDKITKKSLLAELHSLKNILEKKSPAVSFSSDSMIQWSYSGISTPVLDRVVFSEWFLQVEEKIRQKVSDVQIHNKTVNDMHKGLFDIIYFSDKSDSGKRIKDFGSMIDKVVKKYQRDVSELLKMLEA